MKNILLMMALATTNCFFAGDFVGRQNLVMPQQMIIQTGALVIALDGSLKLDKNNFPSPKIANKQKKYQQKATMPKNQKFPKKRIQ